VDPHARYVIYLHGRIIEEEGRHPTSPQFGVYDYDDILRAFADAGLQVISEARPKGTQVGAYAHTVAGEVGQLLDAGVPADHITVVGFSKGGGIAIVTSSLVKVAGVRYVFLAACFAPRPGDPVFPVTGHVLSIHEASDDIGLSCAPLFARSPQVAETREIEISTGKRHGAFFQVRPEWLVPTLAWIEEKE
jgi:dienelactone hydrolase